MRCAGPLTWPGTCWGRYSTAGSARSPTWRNRTMEPGNLENLMEKVKVIAHGPHADLLNKLVDLLYERKMEEPEYFSPEDLAAIEEGLRASLSGDRTQFIPWE